MTNEELSERIRRRELENRYKQLYPEKVSTGKKFMDSFKKDVLFPGLKEGAKSVTIQIVKSIGESVLKSSSKSTNDATKTVKKVVKKSTK